ncbi:MULTISPECIES: hypothetical protein [Streptomyces]|uniref:hypothetical protein n=1 Tax=Streptomyces TaxID=1883 RepID=UPI0018E0123E|nr:MULTISPECIES: hypothetical protein [Streptomyces]MCZ4097097.1 hypothetical protein [Streptomyces sp. H39-C1]
MQPSRGLLGIVCAAVLAVSGLSACTADGDADPAAVDAKSATGDQTIVPAPPGKYRKLPEPCGSLGPDTLKKLVPNAPDYTGDAELTYDTNRRVGCTWTGETSQGNRYLQIDFERVVSYDPGVSDEAQAESDYDTKVLQAGIPTTPGTPGAPGAPATTPPVAPPGSPAGLPGQTPTTAPASPATSPVTSPDLAPRLLTDVGDAAFLDDELMTRDSGVHRDITLVFRTANVLVTVSYAQWSADKATAPQSADLQQGAEQVADVLVKTIK